MLRNAIDIENEASRKRHEGELYINPPGNCTLNHFHQEVLTFWESLVYHKCSDPELDYRISTARLEINFLYRNI